jgi:hypothetical protein
MTAARLAGVALLLTAAAAPAQPPDLKRVHVLIAAEVTDKGLAKMVEMDVKSFEDVLSGHLPGDVVSVKKLTGRELTATNVLTYYKALKVEPTDAVVFYYSGHGSYRDDGAPGPAGDAHTLEFQYNPELGKVSPEAMKRRELKKAMLAKKAALTVILTDCCSDHVHIPPPPDHKPLGRMRGVPPTALGRSLFLTSRGVVDMTAAANGQVAVSDTLVGSYFTAALARAAQAGKDTPATWPAFAATLKEETQRVYRQEARRMNDKEMLENVRTKRLQLPETFQLPDGPGSYAVVALDNPTGEAVKLQVRWGSTAEWSKPFTIPAGEARYAALLQPPGKPQVLSFQVKVNGGEPKTVQAKLVTTTAGKPAGKEGAVYALPDCTPAAKASGRSRGVGEIGDK